MRNLKHRDVAPNDFKATSFWTVALVLCPILVGSAFPQETGYVPFCKPIDFSQVQPEDSNAAGKRALSLNTGEPRTVRVIYFVPNDRSFSSSVEDSIKRAVRQVRSFFTDQMKAHGFSLDAINIETGGDGDPLIHRVTGQHGEDYYVDNTHFRVFSEIGQNYDTSANICIAFIGNSRRITPRGGRNGKTGGEASLGVDFDWQTVAHELGHGFGLHHDFRTDAYVMSYANEPDSLSLCAAQFLSVHPYFNPDITTEWTRSPAVELTSSPRFQPDTEDITVSFKLADSDGLHQLILFATTPLINWGAGGYPEVKAWREMANEGSAVVDLEYKRDAVGMIRNPDLEKIHVNAVDTDGNVRQTSFNLVSISPHHYATLEGHADGVVSVEYSPSGELLASASYDNTIRLWDAATRDLIATLHHDARVHSASFSPDGRLLASASEDRTVKLWDMANRELVATLEGHKDGVDLVRFSPDGKYLASSSWDRAVKLWDVTNRELAATIDHVNSTHSLSFSPDGKILATASIDRAVELWDVGSRELIAALEGHRDEVSSLTFSPDGNILATGSKDRTVKLWDVANRGFTATLEGHKGEVSLVTFSPNGKILATGSQDNTVTLWDVATGKTVAILGGCAFSPALFTFSSDGTMFAVGMDVGNAFAIWDAATGASLATFHQTGYVNSVCFSTDGRFIASGSGDKKVELWDVSSWALPRARTVTKVSGDNQQGPTGGLLASPLIVEVRDQYGEPLSGAKVTFAIIAGDGTLSNGFTTESAITDPDGRAQIVVTLGSIPGTNTVEASIAELEVETFNAVALGTPVVHGNAIDYRTWHLPRGATVRLGKGSLGQSDRAIAYSSDSEILAVASAAGVWLYTENQREPSMLLAAGKTHSVSFSPDGATIAAGGGRQDYGEVSLWDMATGTQSGSIRTNWWVKYLSFSPDGKTLAFGSSGPSIEVWDLAAGIRAATLEATSSIGTSLAFSPVGKTIASGYVDGKIKLWDVAKHANTTTLEAHRREVLSVVFSPDGRTLASASADGTVKLWDIETGMVSATIRGNRCQAECVAFSPDGGSVACGWTDNTVTLWDISANETIATFRRHRDWISAVSFSPSGRTLASAAMDGDVYLWDVATGNATGILGYVGHTNSVRDMAFSPDGATLASHSLTIKGKIDIWDVATGLKKVTIGGHTSLVRSLAFSPDGTTLASASSDSTIRLWDLRTRSTIARLLHRTQLQSVSYSPDGTILATGDIEGNIHLWNVKTQEKMNTLTGLDDRVTKLLFSPDGATLAAGTDGGHVWLWNVTTGATIRNLNGHKKTVQAMAFSRDGTTLATGTFQGAAKLWDVATGELSATLLDEVFESVSFSPDGTMFATGWQDRHVRLNDMSTGDIITTFEGHNDRVTSVLFTPDGRTLASGSSDGTILLWDLAPYREPETPNPDFNGDGAVGFADFIQFAAQFGLSRDDAGYDARYDLDGDGEVGFGDFLIFAGDFGRTAGQ